MPCPLFYKRAWLLSALIGITMATSQAMAVQNVDTEFPGGLWLPKKKDVGVRIEPCGDALCGYVSWLRADVKRLTPEGKPLCNLKVLWGFKQNPRDPEAWNNGKIYKADKGEIYSGRIRVRDTDKIELRGYMWLPVIGKSYVLTRVEESSYPPCSS